MTDFRQKIWTKLYYKTRLSNSREDSKRVANEAVEDFDNSAQTLKQAFDKLPQGNKVTFTPIIPFEDDLSQFMTEKQVLDAIFKRLKESTIGSEKKITWCKYGAELDFEFDSKGAVKSIN